MNGYAISFDMDIEALRQYYGEPYNPAYAEIRSVMLSCGFYWIQGSVYVTPGNLATMYKAIEALKRIEWFRHSVRDIRGFKVEEWSDFTDIQGRRINLTWLKREKNEIYRCHLVI